MIATSLASSARPFWRLLEHYKIDPAYVFREAGLDPALMDKPRERYKAHDQVAAWKKAGELIDDPCFGLKIADYWSPTDLHALGYAFLASSTLRTALERVCRYVHVVNNVVGYQLGIDGDNVSLTISVDNPIYQPLFAPQEDSGWAVIAKMCRAICCQDLNPVEVRFQHSAPKCTDDYDAYFRCPVHFDSERSAILFTGSDVDKPLPTGNRELARANDKILADFLKKLRKDDLITRVKTAVAEELPSGSPSDEEIAKSLYMSPRTLNRKLSALETNYSTLLETVRRELAEQYVADPSLTLSEISFLLGFSEQSAFSRAFRRWTGKAPSSAREAAMA